MDLLYRKKSVISFHGCSFKLPSSKTINNAHHTVICTFGDKGRKVVCCCYGFDRAWFPKQMQGFMLMVNGLMVDWLQRRLDPTVVSEGGAFGKWLFWVRMLRKNPMMGLYGHYKVGIQWEWKSLLPSLLHDPCFMQVLPMSASTCCMTKRATQPCTINLWIASKKKKNKPCFLPNCCFRVS